MAADEKKKYNYMENVLQRINRNQVALQDCEERQNNLILREILDGIILKMKQKDILFNHMYSRVFYGGSYYDGLRVGHPEEFDLDLLLVLPKYAEPDIHISNVPGFVHVKLNAVNKFLKQPEAKNLQNFTKLVDERQYLDTTGVFSWMESVVNKALNEYSKVGKYCQFPTSQGTLQGYLSKSGPALTLKLHGPINGRELVIDIDLVPCFVFTKDKWLPRPYRPCPPGTKTDFFIVPKKPSNPQGTVERYWRLSFQEQERVLMDNLRNLKPAVKLLKLLRDHEKWCIIASYFIKTVFLWEIDTNRSLFSDNSLSYVFMTMLKKLNECIKQQTIKYYWNEKNNLLSKSAVALQNLSNRLENIMKKIEQSPGNSTVIASYLETTSQPLAVEAPQALAIQAPQPKAPSSCIIS